MSLFPFQLQPPFPSKTLRTNSVAPLPFQATNLHLQGETTASSLTPRRIFLDTQDATMPAAINDHPAQDVATALPTTTCDPGASPVPESLTSFDIGDPPLSGTSADNGTDSAGSAPGQNPGCVPENTDSGSTRYVQESTSWRGYTCCHC